MTKTKEKEKDRLVTLHLLSPSTRVDEALFETNREAIESMLEALQPDCIYVWNEEVKAGLMAHKGVNYLGDVCMHAGKVHLFSYLKSAPEVTDRLGMKMENAKLTTSEIRGMLQVLELNVPFLPSSEKRTSNRLRQTNKNSLESFLKLSVTQGILVREGEFLGFSEMANKYKEYYFAAIRRIFDIPRGKIQAFNQLFHYTFYQTSMYNQKKHGNSTLATKIDRLALHFLKKNRLSSMDE